MNLQIQEQKENMIYKKILLNIMIMRVKKCEKVTPDYMHRKKP